MDNVLSNYLKINEKFADAKLGMVYALSIIKRMVVTSM
jgi:hypothetical protein